VSPPRFMVIKLPAAFAETAINLSGSLVENQVDYRSGITGIQPD
jgi:hypothetical protein